jgi:tetratricopeptide (TPR) repeat protein
MTRSQQHFEASMTPSHSRAFGVSPLISLRADLAGRPTTREDDEAIVVAALLRHAAARPGTKASAKSLARARRIVQRALTPDQLWQGPGFDEPRRGLRFKVFRAFADHVMRVRGSATLANNMLDSLAMLIPLASPEGGLLLSQRAATSWYLGDNEVSAERYRQVMRLGKKIREPELIARGMHGLAHVRMSAGNLPEAERLSKRAIELASGSFPRVSAQPTLKLAIINAVRGDFDAALRYAWRAYELSRKFEMDRRVVLANLAQILYDAGHPQASRAAASHLLRLRLEHAIVFSVLGTYARASAALDDSRAVHWCATQLLELARRPSFAQHVADALLECSFALGDVGRSEMAGRLRTRAQEIAVRHGYHDIAYLAEHSTPRGRPRTPARVTRATQAIVSEVRALEPDNRPLVEVHAG